MYQELPNHMNKIFEPRPVIRVTDLSEVNVEALLQETFTITPIHTEKKLQDGTSITVSVGENCQKVVAYRSLLEDHCNQY